MRLFVTAILLLSVSGALIYYDCTKNRNREIQVKQDQASTTMFPTAVHQPQTKNETGNSYDAGKDCLYRIYLFATIAGVLVALGGIYTIWRQTEATEQAARAALLNAQAVINSQRAWIVVRPKEPFIPDRFKFEILCQAGIPAKVLHIYSEWKAVDRGEPLQPTYKTDRVQYPRIVAQSDGGKEIEDHSMDVFRANAPLWDNIQHQRQTLYFYGKVEYTDGVSIDESGKPIIHETTWCYEYVFGAISRSGPSELNDYT